MGLQRKVHPLIVRKKVLLKRLRKLRNWKRHHYHQYIYESIYGSSDGMMSIPYLKARIIWLEEDIEAIKRQRYMGSTKEEVLKWLRS